MLSLPPPLPPSPSLPLPPSWNPNVNLLFMPGSQAQNRKKILKDRNNTSSHSFQTTASFQTSAPVSISRDLDCVPYWNDQVAD